MPNIKATLKYITPIILSALFAGLFFVIFQSQSSPLVKGILSALLVGTFAISLWQQRIIIALHKKTQSLSTDKNALLEKLTEISETVELQSQLRASEMLNKTMCHSLPIAIVTTDQQGDITQANLATTQLLGFVIDEMLGEHLSLILNDTANLYLKSPSADIDEGNSELIVSNLETSAVSKTGKSVPIRLSVIRMLVKGQTMFAITMVDIREENQHRDQITRLANKLEHENMMLKEVNEKSARANRAQQRFISSASHEIRTPLTGIFGIIDLLSDSPLNDEQKEFLEVLRNSSRQLHSLVNDILDAAKLDEGKMKIFPSNCSLVDMAKTLEATYAPVCQDKGLALNLHVDESLTERYLLLDRVRIQQIISNLFNNAIKFTDTGSISCDFRAITLLDDRVELEFSVSDTGQGIPLHLQHQLGQAFVQANNELNRQGTGTGLGLTIVKSLVRAMDGRLSLTSEPGIGSTFRIRLWVEIGPKIKKEQSSIPVVVNTDHLKLYKFLIAEDNPVNRMVIGKIFEKLGVTFRLVEDGQQLLDALNQEDFHLIITDIQMPNMDGVEALKNLRSNPRWRALPVIALTAATFTDEVEGFFKAGFNDVLAKPIDQEVLIKALNMQLSNISNLQPL